ncbi:DUF6864 domain-containing function [Comamonas brasiliensis]|uniref:DUF6864 domain-containing function n=1 Tax=Comamonas brasiliensis TaxID=1812482 RepID=UPI001B8D7F4D|nr:hypothetical protein [Comamonas sp. PE63]
MITIKTGGKDVLDSKTFLSLDLGETTITLGQGNEALSFIFNFITADDQDPKIGYQAIDEKTLKISLTNWKTPLGATLTEPTHVGTFSNRNLYIMFYVKKVGSVGEYREITFTAYLGEEVNDGKN